MSLFSHGRRPDLTFAIEASPDAPRLARRSINQFLNDPEDPLAEHLQLVVSELVTNVVLHADGCGTLALWDPKPAVPLRVEVSDLVPMAQRRRCAEPTGTSGRGLDIVSQLADSWGVMPTDTGKTVWAEFSRLAPRYHRAPDRS